MGGYNSLPVQSGRNPYLDEIDQAANKAHAQLSPGAQMALRKAGAPVGMTEAQPQAPAITTPRAQPPAIAPPTAPQAQPTPRAPIQPVPPTAAAGPAQKELERLTVGPQATAGVNLS